jgi:putative ABC transport system permease protein
MFKFKKQSTNATGMKAYYSVKNRCLFYIAFRNFLDKKLRSSLTVLAVVIGVCAIFFLISFGIGIQTIVTEQVIGDKSLKVIDVTSPNSRILKIDKEVVDSISKYTHVESIGVQYSYPGIVFLNGGEIDVVAYGVNQEYQNISSLNILHGRLLEDEETKSVIVNVSALESLGIKDPESAIGQDIDVAIPLGKIEADEDKIYDSFNIVGVIKSGPGGELFISDKKFEEIGVPNYSSVKAVINDMSNVDIVRSQIEINGFETASLTDTVQEINEIFKLFNTVLLGFGSIGMVVAILGMFNTLTVSLLERTREIGLMMALGARRRDVRKLFVFEAALISFIGAVLGIVLAVILGEIVNFYLNKGASDRGIVEQFDLFVISPLVVILIILGTVILGIVVVYMPARRAERINPIEALRRE